MAKDLNAWTKFARDYYHRNKRRGFNYSQALREASVLYKKTTAALTNQGPNLAKKAAATLKRTSGRKFLRGLGKITRGRKFRLK